MLIIICMGFYAKKYQNFLCFLLGIVWMASVGHWQCSLQPSSQEISEPIWLTGRIANVIYQQQNTRFNLEVSHIGEEKLAFNRRFRVSWKVPTWQLAQGQQIRVLAKLKPAYGLANQGGFHYQQWLFSEGIQATGYVKQNTANLLLDASHTKRQSIFNKINQFELSQGRWIIALSIGFRGLLAQADWNLVQRTGIAHLIAISGLHLALVASLSYFLLASCSGLIISRFYQLHKFNPHYIGIGSALAGTFFYAGLAGFGLPTLRAWIMLLLFTGLFLFNRNLSASKVLFIGISVFIVLFPLSLFGASFWLSFSAVIIIWFVFWRWPIRSAGFSLKTTLVSMFRIQLGLSLLMLPLVAWQFAYISFISPLVNLVAVPLVTFILVPLCLLGVICLFINEQLARELFKICNLILEYGLASLQKVSDLEWTVLDLVAVPLVVWMIVCIGIIALFLPKTQLSKFYWLVLFVPLISYGLPNRKDYWQVDILDVGQGVSVLISANHHAALYDVGASYPSGFNMADSVILPILKAQGFAKLDLVFISHGDNDHAGSLPILSRKFNIQKIVSNQNLCSQGYLNTWENLHIEVLWPDNVQHYNDNNGSCVVKITSGQPRKGHKSILLAGDIDKSIEKRLVKTYGSKLKADILLAPHHGSNTSSSTEFIRVVNPSYVVFSQGFMNRWQFPKPEVVTRYLMAGSDSIVLTATSESGQVRFVIPFKNSEDISMTTFRADLYPYWYANMHNCCTNSL